MGTRFAVSQSETQSEDAALNAKELSRRVRASKVLSGTAKRYWLRVLPHLKEEDRRRLAGILRGNERVVRAGEPTGG